jgi:hypothetical protein
MNTKEKLENILFLWRTSWPRLKDPYMPTLKQKKIPYANFQTDKHLTAINSKEHKPYKCPELYLSLLSVFLISSIHLLSIV